MVPFGDRFYPQDLLGALIERSVNMVAGLDVDLVATQTVNSIPDAQAVARQLEETPCDLIIGFISCWMEPVNFVAALKNMFHKPILLWSLVMFPAEAGSDEMITTGAFVAAAVLRETMDEMGVTHKFIWGMPEKVEVQQEIGELCQSRPGKTPPIRDADRVVRLPCPGHLYCHGGPRLYVPEDRP